MRVTYRTFGCKANQYDSEQMRQAVESAGGATVGPAAHPDVWVVNTCTVTSQADADARRFVRRVHREHPDARIVVAGCSAALKPAAYSEMDGVVGVVAGHDALDVARAVITPARAVADPALVQLTVRKPVEEHDFEPIGGAVLRQRLGRTRGWLKVQDGCDRRCSFCATRLARGESRSRPAGEVVEEARALAIHHPEIVITGIHIGHYGRDLDRGDDRTLSKLVGRLIAEVPKVRFRLGSIEATEIDDALVDLLSAPDGRLATHLHMPLQSGADPVLRRMRRWHTREAYRRRALEIARRVPRLGLGADVITGFPGETDEDHARTRDLIDELPFTYLHVFPYSPRDETVAANLPDPVPQRIAGERARELRELAQAKAATYVSERVGEIVGVVPEGPGSGLTEDYLRVAIRRPSGGPEEGSSASTLLVATLQQDAAGPYIEAA